MRLPQSDPTHSNVQKTLPMVSQPVQPEPDSATKYDPVPAPDPPRGPESTISGEHHVRKGLRGDPARSNRAARPDPPAQKKAMYRRTAGTTSSTYRKKYRKYHAPDRPIPASSGYRPEPASQHPQWRYNAIAPDARQSSAGHADKKHFPPHRPVYWP